MLITLGTERVKFRPNMKTQLATDPPDWAILAIVTPRIKLKSPKAIFMKGKANADNLRQPLVKSITHVIYFYFALENNMHSLTH